MKTVAPSTPTVNAPPAQSFHNLPRNRLIATMAGLLVSLLLAALDQTIVGTAMPRIIADLQGFEHYAWVTTAYLLTSTAIVPIIGKLSDLYGRKWFLMGGAIFFVLMSMLCGLSQNMVELVVFRGLQGFGAGTLMSTIFTVSSALFPPAQRAKIQGLFTSVFGLASIAGPLIGGYLTDTLSWRWVFYVNLPVGILALVVLWLSFPDFRPARRAHQIDFLGGALLVLGIVPFLLALSWGGQDYAWTSPVIIGLFVVSVVGLIAFGLVEARAAEPILPLSLLKNPIVAIASLTSGLTQIGMFGSILFVPLFIQAVIGTSATQSGTVLTPMMLAIVAMSIGVGQVIGRTGRYKAFALGGTAVGAVGLFLLSTMGPDTDYLTVVRDMVIIGLGLGSTMAPLNLAAQNAVSLREIGVVTSLTQFTRSIGGTVGAALLGSVLTSRFAPELQAALPPQLAAALPPGMLDQFKNPQILLNPDSAGLMQRGFSQLGPQGAQLYGQMIEAIKVALSATLHDVFLTGALILALSTLITVFLKELPLKRSYSAEDLAEMNVEAPISAGGA